MNPLTLLKSMFTQAPRLAAAECLEQVRSGDALLIDVREASETRSGAAQGAKLLPLSDLTGARRSWSGFLADNPGRHLLLYCGAGVRSGMAARILRNEGFHATNAGSFSEWSAAGWPVVRPDQPD